MTNALVCMPLTKVGISSYWLPKILTDRASLHFVYQRPDNLRLPSRIRAILHKERDPYAF